MAGQNFTKVYQFRVSLDGTKPPVWRRILVPDNYTFWDLHVAIQDSFGWLDCHLHDFEIRDPSHGHKVIIGIPMKDMGLADDPWFADPPTLPGWKQRIAGYFGPSNPKAKYQYDFGDDWQHTVTLQKILPREKGVAYPVCLAGKRACPPEDCGGIWGHQEICDGSHEYQKEYAEYDPEHFSPDEVHFDDPEKRRQIAFGI